MTLISTEDIPNYKITGDYCDITHILKNIKTATQRKQHTTPIFTDSKNCQRLIYARITNSQLTTDSKIPKLNTLLKDILPHIANNTLIIHKVHSHIGITLNEEVDTLAKDAAVYQPNKNDNKQAELHLPITVYIEQLGSLAQHEDITPQTYLNFINKKIFTNQQVNPTQQINLFIHHIQQDAKIDKCI